MFLWSDSSFVQSKQSTSTQIIVYSPRKLERAWLLKHRSTTYEGNIQYEVYKFKYLWMQSGCVGASSSMLANDGQNHQ